MVLRKIYFILLIIFSSISIVGIEKYTMISPNNISLILLVTISFFMKFYNFKRENNLYTLYCLFSSVMFISTSALNIFFSTLILNFDKHIKKIKISTLLKYLKIHILILNSFFIFELLFRFESITNYLIVLKKFLLKFKGFNFYNYKTHSFMYSDSNYIGIIAGLYIINVYLYSKLTNKQNFILKLLSFLYLIGSLSRAAYIAIFSILVYIFFIKLKKIVSKKIYVLISLNFVTIMTFIMYIFVKGDKSFIGRINIVKKIGQFLIKENTFNLIFGVGYGNSIKALGEYPHNIFLVNLVEGGFVGFILFLMFLKYILKKYTYSRPVIIYYIIVSSSASMYNFSYFIITLLINNEIYRRRELFNNFKGEKSKPHE